MTISSPIGLTQTSMRLMYSSVSLTAFDAASMEDLLAAWTANNQRREITGALMVDGLLNVQFIEGPEPAIRALWNKIRKDERHHCIVQLYEEIGDLPRLFGSWTRLHGQASRVEMLSLIRNAYLQSDLQPRPVWSMAIAPLIILLDPNYSDAYAQAKG